MPAAEVGPQRLGDPDLGIRDLPEQEIADAHLAARTDQQIGIGLAAGVEEGAESLLVQIVRRHARRDRAPRGIDDLGASAIVQRDVELHAAVLRRLVYASLELALKDGREMI